MAKPRRPCLETALRTGTRPDRTTHATQLRPTQQACHQPACGVVPPDQIGGGLGAEPPGKVTTLKTRAPQNPRCTPPKHQVELVSAPSQQPAPKLVTTSP